jgi:hypothetical protein
LGGYTDQGRLWVLEPSRIIEMIEDGLKFHVEKPGGPIVSVIVPRSPRDGSKFLKGVNDGAVPSTLLSLRTCRIP